MSAPRSLGLSKMVPAWTAAQVYARYVRYLLWEFRWAIIVFWSLVFGGGLLFWRFYHHNGDQLTYVEACYGVFLLIFVESYLNWPDEWFLQPFFFLLPVIGLGAVADSVVRLGLMIFNRKHNLPEWHRMVASLYRGHAVVIGLGKVGYQIARGLLELGQAVVIIERPGADGPLVQEMIDRKVPIIRGDGRSAKTLEQAGVGVAAAVLATTSDDLTNLDAGLTARDINPSARVVLRLFDESLAKKVQGAFAMPAISTASVAAPAFVAAATGRKVYQDFQLGGQHLHLVDLSVEAGGELVGLTVGDLQADGRVNVVMHRDTAQTNVNPGHDIRLCPGDELLVIAPLDRLLEVEKRNTPNGRRPPQPLGDGGV